jgi:hypothetical protein
VRPKLRARNDGAARMQNSATAHSARANQRGLSLSKPKARAGLTYPTAASISRNARVASALIEARPRPINSAIRPPS